VRDRGRRQRSGARQGRARLGGKRAGVPDAAFGDRLGEVRAAMEALAASLPPDELDRIGFRLYERFRPEVPEGVEGWGAKAVLDIARIKQAVE
jgi:hypothetical protein